MEIYINVKNFGKIKSARVNIDNFTVFVGNNNSGKTQLMELIYAIIKKSSEISPEVEVLWDEKIDVVHIGHKVIEDLNEWLNKYLRDNINKIIEETFNSNIPIEEVSMEFKNIDRTYDIYFLTDRTIEYLLANQMIEQEILEEMVSNKEKYYGSFVLKKEDNGNMKGNISSRYSQGIPLEWTERIELGGVLADIMGGRKSNSYNVLFLPASRMGLMLLYKYYFESDKKEQEEFVYEIDEDSKGLTKPVADFLSFLLRHIYTPRRAKENNELLEFIFTNLIDGRIKEQGETTTYTPRGNEKEIPIFVASSMVNEVVPIIKALTDIRKVDFIFYDEVETSMHPLKQIEMVKLLNRLNNKGIRLLVSTHSDTMATKINNLLLLSQQDFTSRKMKDTLEKMGIYPEKGDLIDSSKIHVYQFVNDTDDKSMVEELEFKKVPCTGYDFSLFNDSTMSLFEEAKIAMGMNNEKN